ncbi:MAG: PASTA domain-containing protein, partial [Streptosporangiaceae bacterium]
ASGGASALAIPGNEERGWAWGANSCVKHGDVTTTGRNTPELIGKVGATQITMGIFGILIVSSAAIRYDGTLWTWGCNGSGQLANGTNLPTSTPTLVTSLSHVSQFTFGDDSPNLFQAGAYSLAVGTLPATVPNLSGDTTGQASQALQAAGLVLGTVSSAIDYTCNNLGTVKSQNPGAGTNVNPGTAVSITIGKAPPPPHQCT